MTEAELLRAMEEYGFRDVSTVYIALNHTPDHPACPAEFAEAIINAGKQSELGEIALWRDIAPGVVGEEECRKKASLVDARYDERLRLYRAGE
jgi:hypothetical protein